MGALVELMAAYLVSERGSISEVEIISIMEELIGLSGFSLCRLPFTIHLVI